MRVALINPLDIYGRDYWCIPPLSLGYIMKGLYIHGFKGDIIFIDARKEKIYPENLPNYLKKKYGKIDIIGFQVFSTHIDSVKKYIDLLVKNGYGDALFVAGGPHALFEPEDLISRIPRLDFVVSGEGEDILPSLIKGEIPNKNLCFRKNGDIIRFPREFIQDLDFYDAPLWELMHPDTYPLQPQGFFTKGKRVAPIIATRGCPFTCTYCGAPQASGRKIRKRSPELIAREIEYLIKKFGVDEIHFLDDNLTFDKKYALELCEKLKDLKIPWACPNGVRIETLDEEIIVNMEKSGCYALSVGIESGSDRILRLMKRGKDMTKKIVEEKINLIKKLTKIRLTGFFILGFPRATYEDDLETINFALKLNLDHAAFGCFAPLPGSLEWEKLKREGKNPDPSSLCIWKFTYIPEGRTKKELDKLKMMAFLKFYSRPSKLWGAIKGIKSINQIMMILKRLLDNSPI